mgnify:CR=1 FL=1
MNLQVLNNLYMLGKITGDEYANRTALILSDNEREETLERLQSQVAKNAFTSYAEPFFPKISTMLGNMRFHGEGRLKQRIAAVVLALAQSPHKQEPVFKETQDLHGNKAVLVIYKGSDGGERETFISTVPPSSNLYQKVCEDIGLTFR